MNLLSLVFQIVGIGVLIAAVVGIVDVARRNNEAFLAAGKQSKNLWLGLMIGALVVSFLGFLLLAGVVAVLVYFLDVRPAVASAGSGGGSGGPYGGW